MRYSTTMHQIGNNTGIPVSAEILDALGGGRRPAVRVVVNGYEFRGTVGAMSGQALVSFSSDKRAASGIGGGDAIEVELTLDTAPREVEVPGDLAEALDAADARAAFDALAPSHRKAHVSAIMGAKTDATRERRVAASVATVLAG